MIRQALVRIQQSVDPCGESSDIAALLVELRRCTTSTYEICIDPTSSRNVFDRPRGSQSESLPRSITWNPELRSELELGCDGDPSAPVDRDPIASLLHELVHAAQDCNGLNPGEHEIEAVRIENIYRRAAGLCQRQGYGDDQLAAESLRQCSPKRCSCASPTRRRFQLLAAPAVGLETSTASGDAQLVESGGDTPHPK